ncbi:MAG: hypothetical protein ACREAA_01630 [Candidatus Polarisedimenticolia bacterium]
MIVHTERPRLVLVLTVAASVLLFACSGGEREVAQPQDASEAEAAPSSAEAPASPPAPPAQASAAAGPAPVQAAPQGTPAPSGATQAVTFGSVPQDELVAAPRPERPAIKTGSSRVFSNDDLKAYKAVREEYGFADDARSAGASDARSGGKEGGKGAPADAKDTDAKIAEATKKLADLGAELQNLEKRIPSLHNPLLPRVTPLDKDQASEDGMDNAERLSHVKQRIAEVKTEMEELQATLAELRAGPETDQTPDDGSR